MEVEMIPISEIIPYEKNPRKNDKAVDVVAKSITEFGFKQPIVMDKNNVIVVGHTRFKAAQKIGMQEVPIVWADELTEAQVKAYRIMDNKSNEYSYWNYDILKQEILDLKNFKIDIGLTGFTEEEINFFNPDTDKPSNNPYEEWRKSGTLDYENADKMGYKTILLHFKEAKDCKAFSELLNQTITEKTKYLWYPQQAIDKVSDLTYEEQ